MKYVVTIGTKYRESTFVFDNAPDAVVFCKLARKTSMDDSAEIIIAFENEQEEPAENKESEE